MIGTPGTASALGRPRPKLTAVRTFSPVGSSSRVALPSQPSVPTSTGSHVCQMSIALKWDRLEFGYPIPCTTATVPSSNMSLSAAEDGCQPSSSSIGSTLSAGMPTTGRES